VSDALAAPRRRPGVVTLVAIVLVVWGLWSAVGLLIIARLGGVTPEGMPFPPTAMLGVVIQVVLRITIGAGLWRGATWARPLFLIGVPIEIVFGIGLGFAVAAERAVAIDWARVQAVLIANLVPYAVLAMLLSTRRALEFLRPRAAAPPPPPPPAEFGPS
jgi:hypothetical protein